MADLKSEICNLRFLARFGWLTALSNVEGARGPSGF